MHSDRGSQFCARNFVHALNFHHLIGSMGKVDAAGHNGAMESFFALRQKNVLDRKRWRTREELRIAIITWIERTYYHRCRRPAAPIDFRVGFGGPRYSAPHESAQVSAWLPVGLCDQYS